MLKSELNSRYTKTLSVLAAILFLGDIHAD